MILRLFRSNQPALALWLPVLGVILWLPGWWLDQPPDFSMTLFGFGSLANPWSADVGTFIAFVLLLAGAMLFNNLFQQYDLIERKNQLPGLCYVIAFSWSPFLLQYSHLLIGQLFVLLAIRRLMLVYRQPNVVRELFDTGLFVGLAALFYLPFALFLIACWVSLGVLRTFNLREWLMPLTGIATIGVIFFSLNYLFDWQAVAFLTASWYPVEGVLPVGLFGWFKYVVAIILLMMTLVAAPSFMAALTRSTMRDRNLKMILLFFGANTVGLYLMFLVIPGFGSNVLLLAFPVALMLVYAVADKRVNWMISGLFYALLFAAVVNNYGMLALW
jgi:hypothetical protein